MQRFDNSEAPGHPLTREGFLAWAEDQVIKRPELNGEPNTVERQLAEALVQNHCDGLLDQSTRVIKGWLWCVLMKGLKGFAEMSREELLDLIDQEIIQTAYEATTVEEAVCLESQAD